MFHSNDNLRFNVNAFKAGSTGSAGLSNRARYILMKPPWERTEEELELINSIVNRLNVSVTKFDHTA